ncbi:MAG: hypothetical protein IKW90_00410 [Lachnospiraceae bacterium]|nr:hypothetical protein [Lachnospiraceae bacterium]
MAFCPLCGKQLPANGICSCGKKLDEQGNIVDAVQQAAAPMQQAVQQAPQQVQAQPAPQPQPQQAPQQQVPPAPKPQPQPKPQPVFTAQQLADMKTRLGISAGAIAAVAFLVAYFSGYFALIAIVGAVVIFDNNEWLKKNVVKALVLLLCFSLINAVLYLIPDLLGIIYDAAYIGNVALGFVSKTRQVFNVLNDIIVLCKEVLFILLAFCALKMKTIRIGFIDNLIDKAFAQGK